MPQDLEDLWSPVLADRARALWGVDLTAPKFAPILEPPQDLRHGDAASSVAFKLAKELGRAPAAIAEELAASLRADPPRFLEGAEVAKPGYLNLRADAAYAAELLDEVRAQGDRFGRWPSNGRRVNVEFCSANPTGPLTVAHARQAAVGDALACVLEWAGWDVTREYYVNDGGGQIESLGTSLLARLRGEPVPEGGYHGEYLVDMAREVAAEMPAAATRPPSELARIAAERLLASIRRTLDAFGVRFGIFTSQAALEAEGRVDAMLRDLRAKGLTYEKEGAGWLRTKDFGDVDDKVLVKSDGAFTYRTTDIAYHLQKFERGFERLIDLWGPDHHAHIATMKAGLKACGHADPEAFEVLIVQHCRLLRGGEEVKMSKRAGKFVTLDELLAEVGRDAARYFFLMRKADSPLDFDIEVAKRQSLDNPVYYVQYAHARIASIYRIGTERGQVDPAEVRGGVWTGRYDRALLAAEEVALLRRARTFRRLIAVAARRLDPSLVTLFAHEVAESFQSYYARGDKDRSLRVLADDEAVRRVRLAVVGAIQTVLRNALSILGVSAPERM